MYVGKALRRPEDFRFLTGKGKYVDDVKLPGCTFVGFLRSPHAHARIARLDAGWALACPGVIRIVTAQDWVRRATGSSSACIRCRPPMVGHA